MNLDELKEMMNAGGRYDVTFEVGGNLISAYPIFQITIAMHRQKCFWKYYWKLAIKSFLMMYNSVVSLNN